MRTRFESVYLLLLSIIAVLWSTGLLAQARPRPVIVFVNGWQDCCAWNFSTIGNEVAETASNLNMIFRRTSWDSFESESLETGIGTLSGTSIFVNQGIQFFNSLPYGTDVYLIGHSWGGDSLLDLVSTYNDPRINIRLLAVIDPVSSAGMRASLSKHTVGNHVEYFHNIWQLNAPFPDDFDEDGTISCNAYSSCDQRENNFRRNADGTNLTENCTWAEFGCQGRVENPLEAKPGWKLQRTTHQDLLDDDYVAHHIATIITELAGHRHAQELTVLSQSFLAMFGRSPSIGEKDFINSRLAAGISQEGILAIFQRTKNFFASLNGNSPSPAEFLWFNFNIGTRSETLLSTIISSALANSPVFVGDVTDNFGELYGSFNSEYVPLGGAGWRSCPNNSTLAGEESTPSGFWTCLNNLYSNRNIVIGDVEQNVASEYIINKQYKVAYGSTSWNHCQVGTFSFRKMDPDGFWVCLSEPLPSSPEAIIGDVRNNIGYRYVVSGSKGLLLDTSSWNSCPSGYSYIGNSMSVDGFWLCVRNDLSNRRFIVGDVVNNTGFAFQLYNGSATGMGSLGWNSCPTGALVGNDYHSNGFWICKGDIVYTGPDAYIGDVRFNTGYLYSVSNGSVGFAGTAGWNYCPAGYQLVGTNFHSNGFWLCARPDFVNSAFFVGDVTNNSGPAYKVQSYSATYWGGFSWNSCPFGYLIGTYMDSNGFWICRQ
ncbi:hypothetical protein [Oligoflexus tunisiensis]|uniref:hypothetical protein n=1 Tax=Oligoflexus tunisiensis TaxID=708132 RepID=UPI00114D2811|nr:hypothetical protein [Oligoflexus tunisiensis]